MNKPSKTIDTSTTPKFIDEIKDAKVLSDQEQRKQDIKERIAQYVKL